MKLETPDVLRTIDRPSTTGGGVLGTIAGATDAGGKSTSVARGPHFAAVLKNEMQAVGSAGHGKGAAASAGKGQSQRPGETLTQFLNRQKNLAGAAAADDRHAEAQKAATGLVSNALILPVLKQLRRSTFGENSVFSGGNGEKTFGPEFDMQLADRIAQSPNLGIRDALAAKLEKRGQVAKASGLNFQAKAAVRLDVNG